MAIFTLCFCGTDCWPDESLTGGHNPSLYGPAGYLPVKIFTDIDEGTFQRKSVMPGPGGPWGAMNPELWVPSSIVTTGRALRDTTSGESMWDLAGHAAATVVGVPSLGRKQRPWTGALSTELISKVKQLVGANVDPARPSRLPSGQGLQFSSLSLQGVVNSLGGTGNPVTRINLIGHSRGAVAAIMAAHDLFSLFGTAVPVSVFAIDPVPGSGPLSDEMTRLAANVDSYVGVYAVDETSNFFNGVVPWPRNGGDPLSESDNPVAEPGYHLIYAPGRHSTVAGGNQSDGDTGGRSDAAEQVGLLVNRLARACMRYWGTAVAPLSGTNSLATMKSAMGDNAAAYRDMRNHHYPGTFQVTHTHYNERGITSTSGSNPSGWSYMEEVIGISLGNRLTQLRSRRRRGRVRWTAIQDVPNEAFENGLR